MTDGSRQAEKIPNDVQREFRVPLEPQQKHLANHS